MNVALRVIDEVESRARMSKVPGAEEISWHSVAVDAQVAPSAGMVIDEMVFDPNAGARVMAKVY